MKRLRWKSLQNTLSTIIALLILVVLCSFVVVPALSLWMKGPQDLETVDLSGDIDGLYVTGTATGILGVYRENVSHGRINRGEVLTLEYVMTTDGSHYMGLLTHVTKNENAERLFAATENYLNGRNSDKDLAAAQYTVTGTIKKMTGDRLAQYYESIGWYTMDAETQAMCLPYYLSADAVGVTNKVVTIIFAVVGGICLLLLIFIVGKNITGRYQHSVTQYIRNSKNPAAARERVEKFLSYTPVNNNFQYDNHFICGQDGGYTTFVTTKSVALAYLNTEYTRQNFRLYIADIFFHFSRRKPCYSVCLGLSNGTTQSIPVKSKDIAQGHLEAIRNICPQAIVCFSEENQYEDMFNKNLLGFLNLRYNKVMGVNTSIHNHFEEL